MGEKITITGRDGFRFGAYLALPRGAVKGGLVVCQEIFGVNDYLKSVCEFYGAAGYVTVAPQLFDRIERDIALDYSPQNLARALEFIPKADWNTALDDVDAARQRVRSAGAPKVGVLGFCWGGTLAWLCACRRDVDCAVAYYGSEIDDFPHEHARHPVIMHIGDADRTIPPDRLARIRSAQADTPIHVYPGAPHGFDNTIRHGTDGGSAKLARQRTLEFLAEHLGD